MTARCCLYAFLTLVTLAVACNPAPVPRSQETARSYAPPNEETTRLTSELSAAVPQLLERYGVPGASIALVVDGELAWAAGYGWTNVRTRQPVTPDTTFAVGTVSEPVAAWGVMRLVEAGKLDLDAPVDSYLQRWHVPPSRFDASTVTARRLLSHTAGLSVGTPSRWAASLEDALVARMAEESPATLVSPPDDYFYSFHDYSVLQLAVKEASGRPFAEYMQHDVLGPLGMNDSSFAVTWRLAASAATGHTREGVAEVRPATTPKQAAIGLTSTAPDLARFLSAHFETSQAEPGRLVVSPQSLQSMLQAAPGTTARASGPRYSRDGMGMGYMRDHFEGAGPLISHTHFIGIWGAAVAALPEKRAGIVVLTNGGGDGFAFTETLLCGWLEAHGAASGSGCEQQAAVLGPFEIYRVNIDGTELTRITHTETSELYPQLSPDGSKLAFHRSPPDSNRTVNVHVMDVDRTNERQLTRDEWSVFPDWSPDGSRLLFTCAQGGRGQICTMAADGTGRRQLTRGQTSVDFPSWSPDGRRIAYAALTERRLSGQPVMEIEIIPSDGGTPQVVTESWGGTPSWSPDGTRLAYILGNDIYTVTIEDRAVRRLTNNGIEKSQPAWSPDGGRIAFSAGQFPDHDIVVMRADGSEPGTVVSTPGHDILPEWSLDGRVLFFASEWVP